MTTAATAATAATATTATGIATAAATKVTKVTGIDNTVCYFLIENASRMEWHATIWPGCTAHAPNTSGAKPSPPPPLLLSAA
jgi:hypothetical protein